MKPILVPAIALLLTTPALALDTSMQVVLQLDGNAERNITKYQCDGVDEPLTVEYINASPTFLAFMPIEDQKLIFVSVLAASGAKYASGQYVWWTKGANAELYDLTQGEDAKPTMTCLEATETP
ncbi:MAG TPA: MliC family protein [Devosiaceae bacterium]|jgi:membrane-bound inhibitor of C-type lysozyme